MFLLLINKKKKKFIIIILIGSDFFIFVYRIYKRLLKIKEI